MQFPIAEDEMHNPPLKSWLARLASALCALAAASALSAASAQESLPPAAQGKPSPAITLAPVPDAPVKLGGQDSSTPAAPSAPAADAVKPVGAESPHLPAADATPPATITLPPVPDAPVKLGGDDSKATGATPAADAAKPAEAQAPAPDTTKPAEAQAPAAPPAPLPPLDAALKDDVAALVKAEVPRGSAGTALRREREAIADFYTQRTDAPLWIANGDWTAAAKSALARLDLADNDGLDIQRSTLPKLTAGTPVELAAAELALSEAVVTYGRQASGSRIDPLSISPLITEKPVVAQPAQILSSVASAADAGAALEDFNPPQAGYKALREKLAELRRGREAPPAVSGGMVKIGKRELRAPVIRARYGAGAESKVAAQSGVERTRLENEILVNMERWRWLPRDIGSDRIDVNIPDFALALVHDNAVVHRARVVVGKPDTPTPIFSNAMQYIELNPYWNVPQSIVEKEMLPHLAQDPDYLQRMGYEVTRRNGRLIVRQPPGERNALGRIKFMFPNDHAVYLHDTPEKSLFKASRRAFSHGCVRVDQPLQLAELVLGKDSGWTAERIEKLISGPSGPNRAIHLPKALPIHLEYFTVWVDENGKLQTRDDIYNYSRLMKVALGLKD